MEEFTLEIELESREEIIEIVVECEYEIQNDGIGHYEYWGDKGFDAGNDYVVITNTEWDKTGFTPEEIDEIERQIENHKPKWETEISEKEPYYPDYEYEDRLEDHRECDDIQF